MATTAAPDGDKKTGAPIAPVAQRRPEVLETHGDERVDDFFWLRDATNPEVIEHLSAENAFTEASLSHVEPLIDTLFEEIKSRIVETDLSVPVRKGPWWYLNRTVEGLSYPIHSRMPVSGEGADRDVPPMAPDDEPQASFPGEEVLIDENALAEGHDYLSLGVFDVSPDHNLLAYALDTTGDERFTLRFKDLTSGEDLADTIDEITYGSAWADDNVTFFYVRADEANRPHQIWRHRLGTEVGDDVLVFEEPDERFHIGVRRLKDGEYISVASHSKLSSEVHLARSGEPEAGFTVIEPRRPNVEYEIEHHHQTLLMITNEEAPNFKLVASRVDAPVATSDQGGPIRSWTEVIPHRSDVRLDGIDVMDQYLVCAERLEASPRVRVHDLDGAITGLLGEGWLVPVDEDPSASWIGPNLEPESALLRYEYSSMVTPRTVLDMDLRTRDSVVLKRQRVLGGYDPAKYLSERLWATGDDGTLVPISILRRRDTAVDGTAPCVLYGYGAYEISIDPTFSSLRLSLIDRGFVYAIAHVRGGGELGRHWYEEGKLLEKPNTFKDFIACGRHLVDGKWAAPGRVVSRGGSAGGLTVGAATNMAPELFAAVVAQVPFVDCLTTMLDPTLPLTVTEWDEWGNPEEEPVYRVMKSYSPYDNVEVGVRYPDILATGGLTDPRVGFWEPTKWVQKLRAACPESRVLLKMEMGAGHAGPSGRYDAWKEEALSMAFILDSLGMA